MSNNINLVEYITRNTKLDFVDEYYNGNHNVTQLELIYNSELIGIIHCNPSENVENIILSENSFRLYGYVQTNTEDIIHYPTEKELMSFIQNLINKYDSLYSEVI